MVVMVCETEFLCITCNEEGGKKGGGGNDNIFSSAFPKGRKIKVGRKFSSLLLHNEDLCLIEDKDGIFISGSSEKSYINYNLAQQGSLMVWIFLCFVLIDRNLMYCLDTGKNRTTSYYWS